MSPFVPSLPTRFIIFCISKNCLSRRFTSCTDVPEPDAMRWRREALMMSGRRRSFGVIDWIDPSAAVTCEMITLLLPHLGVPIDALGGAIAADLMAGVVIDTATFEKPISPARGIDVVLCNGAVVWRDGKPGDGRAGRALLRQDLQAEAKG